MITVIRYAVIAKAVYQGNELMDIKINSKIIQLAVCVVLMIVSGLLLYNQIKADKAFNEIVRSRTEPYTIKWDDSYKDNYREQMEADLSSDRTNPVIAYDSNYETHYVINKKSKKIHASECSSAKKILSENMITINENEFETYIENGYSICSVCNAGR